MEKIIQGKAKIVVGARSAIFAPVENLGLIIIDEEHDASYKAGNTPRYHARQVAMMRSSRHQSLLVMGSATPSLEAWHAMSENNNTAQTHRKIERWGKTRNESCKPLLH